MEKCKIKLKNEAQTQITKYDGKWPKSPFSPYIAFFTAL